MYNAQYIVRVHVHTYHCNMANTCTAVLHAWDEHGPYTFVYVYLFKSKDKHSVDEVPCMLHSNCLLPIYWNALKKRLVDCVCMYCLSIIHVVLLKLQCGVSNESKLPSWKNKKLTTRLPGIFFYIFSCTYIQVRW